MARNNGAESSHICGLRAIIRHAPFPFDTMLAPAELPWLLASRPWRRRSRAYGADRGVLLIPGFLAADATLMPLASWLRRRGFEPITPHIGLNVDCSVSTVDRLERILDVQVANAGCKAFVIGHSRGGHLGRLLATRRPDLVEGLVMVGSPVHDPLGVHTVLVQAAKTIACAGGLGLPGLMTEDCISGDCAARVNDETAIPLDVPALAFYSRRDTVVPWQSEMDPSAENVEIRTAHVSMTIDPDFYRALDSWLRRTTGNATDAAPQIT